MTRMLCGLAYSENIDRPISFVKGYLGYIGVFAFPVK